MRPLVERLTAKGVRVWYDEDVLAVGDSLEAAIDRGLEAAEHGIVVLSPAFFAAKGEWTRRERDALRDRVLLVWHDVDAEDVARHAPELRDVHAARTADGLDRVVDLLLVVLAPGLLRASTGGTAVDLLELRPAQRSGDNLFRWSDDARERFEAGESSVATDFRLGVKFALRAFRDLRITRLDVEYAPYEFVRRATDLKIGGETVALDLNDDLAPSLRLAAGDEARVELCKDFRVSGGIDRAPRSNEVVRYVIELEVLEPRLSRAYRVDGLIEGSGQMRLLGQVS